MTFGKIAGQRVRKGLPLAYKICLSPSAQEDLSRYRATDQRRIVESIMTSLAHQPLAETKHRKPLRPNPVAPWELRVGRFRVFYQVEGAGVRVIAIGHKEHNRVLVTGREVDL